MPDTEDLVSSLENAVGGMTLAELLEKHPGLARRSLQRRIARLLDDGLIVATGNGRARRYRAPAASQRESFRDDAFPDSIPLSADSRDVLSYVDRPLHARVPVEYQRDFLEEYRPGQTWYLPAALRRQLGRMGDTGGEALPAGTYGRAVIDRLLIDLSWASSHLEGNTYSRLDTRRLIEHGRAAHGKGAIETQMILNHKAAIEMIVDNVDAVGFDRYTLMNLHGVLAENLLTNPADEGRPRRHTVEITGSVFRPLAVPALIEELFDLVLDKAERISDPFEQAFFVMVHLPYLQPFADVNKRTSRLLANLPLVRANLCPLTFLGVPGTAYGRATLGVYELTRVELLRDLFVWAYERSTQEYLVVKRELTEPDPVRLAYRSLIKRVVRDAVLRAEEDSLVVIGERLDDGDVNAAELADVEALIVDELRRLHEGVLARYGLRPSEFARWKELQADLDDGRSP